MSLMRNSAENSLNCINQVSLDCVVTDSFKEPYQTHEAWFPYVKSISHYFISVSVNSILIIISEN